MKTLFRVIVLLLLATCIPAAARAQLTGCTGYSATANFGLGLPTLHSTGWGTCVQSDLSAIDQLLLRYGAPGGTAQAQTVTLSSAITAYSAGLEVKWTPVAANTGAAPTLNVNGLGAKTIVKVGGAALVANDLTTTAVAFVIYDGTNFELQDPQTSASGAGTGGCTNQVVTAVNSGSAPSCNSVSNTMLQNPSTTVNSQTCTLGSSCSIPALQLADQQTGASYTIPTSDFGYVLQRSNASAMTDTLPDPTVIGQQIIINNCTGVTGDDNGGSACASGSSSDTVSRGTSAAFYGNDVAYGATSLVVPAGKRAWLYASSLTKWHEFIAPSSSGGSGYATIQSNGSSLTQRTTLNAFAGLIAVDNSSSTRTDIREPVYGDGHVRLNETFAKYPQTNGGGNYMGVAADYNITAINGTCAIDAQGHGPLASSYAPSVGYVGAWTISQGGTPASGNDCALSGGFYGALFPAPGAIQFTIVMPIKLVGDTNDYHAVGLQCPVNACSAVSLSAASGQYAIWLDVTDTASQGNWACHTASGGTPTSPTTTTETADTNTHVVTFQVSSSAVNVLYDGTQICTTALTIPNKGLVPVWESKISSTTAEAMATLGWTFYQ